MTPGQALSFARKHGVVLESAKGPVPSLAQAVAGEPIRGSWWGHAKSHDIFAASRAVRDSGEFLICRLINGKVTFVHRRFWPALVRCANRFPQDALAQMHERHMPNGHHVTTTTPFPEWVSPDLTKAARSLSVEEALRLLGDWVS